MESLRTENISFSIGDKNILSSIFIHLKKGQTVGIIGPNGSGKSTLLKIIYRTLKAKSGAVYLDEQNINDMSYKESAQKMAIVAQNNEINFDFTVMEIVLFGRSPYKKMLESNTEHDYNLCRRSLQMVGMEDFIDRKFTSLSGGEQQRVILARALAQDTDCMILDEPTNHLDIKYQLDVLSIIKSLGISCLVALHDLNIAAQFCDYVYTLKEGKVVARGEPKTLFTRDFIREVYEVDARILDVDGTTTIVYKIL